MGKHPVSKQISLSNKVVDSLLSQVTLHFEYDKKINEVRANLQSSKSQLGK